MPVRAKDNNAKPSATLHGAAIRRIQCSTIHGRAKAAYCRAADSEGGETTTTVDIVGTIKVDVAMLTSVSMFGACGSVHSIMAE